MSGQRKYKIKSLIINGLDVSQVIISNHYELKHSSYMTDELILNLVKELDGRVELPIDIKDEFSYFVTLVEFKDKSYKLVWLLEDKSIYIGVVNAHRMKSRR